MARGRSSSSGSVRRLNSRVAELQRRLRVERNLRYASDRQIRRSQRRRMSTAELPVRRKRSRSWIRGISRLGGGGIPRLALPGVRKRRRRRRFRCAKWVRR